MNWRHFFLTTVRLSAAPLLAVLLIGCSAKSKASRSLARGNAFFENGEFAKAKFEYLAALRGGTETSELFARLGKSFLELGEPQSAFESFARARQLNPDNLEARSNLAVIFLAAGSVTNARAEAEFVLAKDPLNGEALLVLASSSTNAAQLAETSARISKLLSAHPSNSVIYLADGNIKLRTKDLPGANRSFVRAVELAPSSPQTHSALAMTYALQGMTNEALSSFSKASELAPVRSGERLRYAEFLLRIGRPGHAENLLQGAVERDASFVPALNMLADIALSQRRTNDAAALLTRSLTADQNNSRALILRARLNLQTRSLSQAVQDLDRAAAITPSDPAVHYLKALALSGNRDINSALESVERALVLNTNNYDALLLRSELLIAKGDQSSAIQSLLRITRERTNAPRPLHLLASAYRFRGNTNEALGVYRHLAEITPRDPQPPYMMGLILAQQLRTNEARALFEKAAELSPAYIPPIDALIELDLSAADFSSAVARTDKYVAEYPDRPAPFWFRAKVLAAQNKIPAAEADLKRALELDPDYLPAQQFLARIYIAGGNLTNAIARLESVVLKSPQDFRSHWQIGSLYEALGDRSKAIAAYERALAIRPRYGIALNNLAYLLSESGDLQRAYDLARTARAELPSDPAVADTYGWILFRRGEYDKSLPLIQEAADGLPRQPEIALHLGLVYYQLDREQDSRQIFSRLLAANLPARITSKASNCLAIIDIEPSGSNAVALRLLETRLEEDPSDVVALIRLGRLKGVAGSLSKARAYYERARQVSPRSPFVLLACAEFFLDFERDATKALSLAKEAWGLSEDSSMALSVGRVAFEAGDPHFCLSVLQAMERSDEKNSRAAYYSALGNFMLGRISQAREKVANCLNSQARFPEAGSAAYLAALIQYLQSASGTQAAESAVKELLANDQKNAPALFVSGVLHSVGKDYVAAKAAYEAALQAYPAFFLARKHLAVLLADHFPDDPRAQSLAADLRVEFGSDPDLLRALGKVAFRRSEYRDAARFLTESAAKGGETGDLMFHLGMALHKLNDKSAREVLNRAVALDPQSPFATEARKALAQPK